MADDTRPIDLAERTHRALVVVHEVLRSDPAMDVRAVGSRSLRDVSTHLLADFPVYIAALRGIPSPDRPVDGGDLRGSEVSRRLTLLEHEFLAAARALQGDPEVRWRGDVAVPASTVCAVALGEALVHGYDVARADRRRWKVDPSAVGALLQGMRPVITRFVDPVRAAGVTARYAVTLRGAPAAGGCLAFDDGVLTVESEPGGRVDCTVSADPAAMILVLYGRTSGLLSTLTGRIRAGGRKPWLGLRLPTLFRIPTT